MGCRNFLFCIVLVLPLLASGQRGYELGAWLGVSHYFGDLNTTYQLKRPGPAGGIIARYNYNDRLSVRITGNYGRMEARDSDSENQFQRSRNLSFRSGVIDGSLQFEFNFFSYVHGSSDAFFTPYILLGGGFYYFNPKANINDTWVPLQALGTEGQAIGGEYNLVQPNLSYGLGLKLDLSYEWSLNIELSGRALFSDYLDDVSTVYTNRVDLLNNRGQLAVDLADRSLEVLAEPIGEPGRQRGNSRNNDTFGFLSIGLVYYIGTLECPALSRPGG